MTLPFGLASAPWVFTKVLAVVLALLRQWGIAVTGYLYDLLLCGDPFCADGQHGNPNAHFAGNLQESPQAPTRRLEYLGLILDLVKAKGFCPIKQILETLDSDSAAAVLQSSL